MPVEEDEVFVPEFEEPTSKKIAMYWPPVHCPNDYYLRCKGAVTTAEPVNQVLILTTSTAPGILFAAHELGAETHVYYDQASEHGFAHGQEWLGGGLRAQRVNCSEITN